MPIRLNLLAEAQELEESRRRDPVKRAIWVGALGVIAMLVWSSSLWVKGMVLKSDAAAVETALNSHTNQHQQVVERERRLQQVALHLTALERLTTNRFLNGNMLNALQLATAENVQLMRLKVEQEYVLVAETKTITNGTRVTPGQPAKSIEKISVVLKARDFSQPPGGYTKFKDAILASPYFQSVLTDANAVTLKDVTAPQATPDGKTHVEFSLECRYPEKTR